MKIRNLWISGGEPGTLEGVELSDQVQRAMTEAQRRVPKALQALKRHYSLTNDEIAQAMGEERNWVQARVQGDTRCSMADLAGFAFAFGATVDVLYEDENTVIRWVLDHPEKRPAWLAVRVSSCFPHAA